MIFNTGVYIETGVIRLQGVSKENPECRLILFTFLIDLRK